MQAAQERLRPADVPGQTLGARHTRFDSPSWEDGVADEKRLLPGGPAMTYIRLPPSQLDGADVLLWATSRTGLFHTIPHASAPTEVGVVSVPVMAICRYPGEARYYLFKCNWNWEVVFDWDAESVEDAQAIAATHAQQEPVEWQPHPSNQV